MRKFSIVAFDEIIYSPANTTTSFYSKMELADALAMADRLALQAVVDNVSAGGTGCSFKVQVEHSADGRNFTSKNGGSAEIGSTGGQSITANMPQTAYYGYEPGTIPSLSYVRLRVDLIGGSTSTINAHIKVFAVGRDDS